jgi:hypothetical protein
MYSEKDVGLGTSGSVRRWTRRPQKARIVDREFFDGHTVRRKMVDSVIGSDDEELAVVSVPPSTNVHSILMVKSMVDMAGSW